MKSRLLTVAFTALLSLASAADRSAKPETILFVGNSFTFGQHSAFHYYRSGSVTDLNAPGPNGKTVGGVPAIFKAFSLLLTTPMTLPAVSSSGPPEFPG